MLGECLVICPSFTAADRAALEAERYLHPHPKVQRELEAVYLKSLELPHHLICRICQISKPTLVRYLRTFEQEGLAGLKQLGYEGRPNGLHPHAASLEQHFRQNPPSTCAQAQAVIAAQTGVRRGLTQVRAFLHRLEMKYRKTGFVPGKADTPEKQAEQAEFLKKTSNPSWLRRKRASGWCFS
jgi:transposase